jgi:sortase A
LRCRSERHQTPTKEEAMTVDSRGADRTSGRNRSFAWTARILLAVGVGCLGWVAWSLSEAAVVEAVESRRLAEARSDQLSTFAPSESADAARVSAMPGEVSWGELGEGDLVGKIEIRRLGVSAIMLRGTTARTLRRAVGHIPGTALPGEAGNVGLAGHRDSFFRDLSGIRTGDTISLATPHGDVHYQVDSVFVVEPEGVHVLAPPATGEMVTLVTCYPFNYVGPAPGRFIVQGHRLTPPATGASPGRQGIRAGFGVIPSGDGVVPTVHRWHVIRFSL